MGCDVEEMWSRSHPREGFDGPDKRDGQADDGFQKGGKASKGVEGFVALVESMRQNRDQLSLPEIVERMLEHSGLRAHYRSEREGVERLENLDELINAATNFVHEAEDDSLLLFLSHASLEAGEHQAAGGQDALQLMVHSAKGLNFIACF